MKVLSARFRKCLAGAATLFVVIFSAPAQANAPWQAGERYALIVGIDNYLNESVTDLSCATADAILLRDTLVSRGKFSGENIFLLTSDSTEESKKPNLTNIVYRLEWLRQVVGPGDTLVFYFAGHGVSMDSETYLLTEDSDQRSKGTLMASSLRGSVLNQLLKSAGAQNTLVLLDACRNDPTAGRGDQANTLSPALARGLVFKPLPAAAVGLERHTATIFACSEGERSWEWGDKKQGFFTYFLAQAFREGGAYDGEGNATLQGLVGYLRDKVNAAAQREVSQAQTPMLRYEGPGADQWVLARTTEGVGNHLAVLDKAALIARVEAAELQARKATQELAVRESQRAVEEAEREVAARREALQQAQQTGGDVSLAKDQLEFAEDSLALAREELAASDRQFASLDDLQTLAEAEGQAVRTAQAYFGGQQDGLDVGELEKELAKLREDLEDSERRVRDAVERAVTAERQVAMLERQLREKWEGRWKGKRPTRRTHQTDLWKVFDPGAEEADSL